MPFQIIPASQVAKPAKKSHHAKNRSTGTSKNQIAATRKSTASGASRTTVSVAAYGGKLFEPIMAREKPIFVHFHEFYAKDEQSITRFSDDGWFAIKYILEKDEEGRNKCYLIYFLNPIVATKDHSLMQACQEAVEYKVYEFYDTTEYVEAIKLKNVTGRLSDIPDYNINKLRAQHCLGQAEQMIVVILREKITAEKFLKRQKEYQKQEAIYQQLLAKEEMEKEDEDITGESGNDTDSILSADNVDTIIEEEENQETSSEERQEGEETSLPKFEITKRAESEVKSQPKLFVWGGNRK